MCIVQIDSNFFVVYEFKTRHMSALTKFVQKRPDVIVVITAVLMGSTAAALVYIMTQCQRDDDEPRMMLASSSSSPRPCEQVTGTIESPEWTKRLKALTENGNDSDIFSIVRRNWDSFDGNTCKLDPIDPPQGAPTGNYYGAPALSVLWDADADADAGAVSLVSQPHGSITTSVDENGIVSFKTGAHFAFFIQVLRSAINTDTSSGTSSPTLFVRNLIDGNPPSLLYNVVVRALQMNPETDFGENGVPNGCAADPDLLPEETVPQQAGAEGVDTETVWFLVYAKLPTGDSDPAESDIANVRNELARELGNIQTFSDEDETEDMFVFSSAYPLEDQDSPPAVFQMSFTGPTC